MTKKINKSIIFRKFKIFEIKNIAFPFIEHE